MPTGIPGLALPRGTICEVSGPASSGRTTFLCNVLAAATRRRESCAVIDTADTFDPASAVAAGADLRFVLWIRCAARKKYALQAADWLLQAGGFGVVALDMANLAPRDVRNIPLNIWFRFRRAVEHKPTVLLAIAAEHCTGSAAALQLEMSPRGVLWGSTLLNGAAMAAIPRKPVGRQEKFEAQSCLLA